RPPQILSLGVIVHPCASKKVQYIETRIFQLRIGIQLMRLLRVKIAGVIKRIFVVFTRKIMVGKSARSNPWTAIVLDYLVGFKLVEYALIFKGINKILERICGSIQLGITEVIFCKFGLVKAAACRRFRV